MEPMATLRSERESTKDGGLILMKGSSKLFDELFAKKREQDEHEDKPPLEEETRDLFIFKEEDVKWFESRGYTLQKINIGPGDLNDANTLLILRATSSGTYSIFA
ncbi:Phytanoyl-CoA dioxygenase [Pyrenophora teres f. maculata]|nr:Phytanoyl-CoA dioxygenase [Pyrenophora teres f. maculata]